MSENRETALWGPVDAVGRAVNGTLLYLVDLTAFIINALSDWRGIFNRAAYNAIISQIIFTGIDALPAISILALAVGASITTQLILLVQAFGTEADVIRMITQLVGMELSPLLAAIIVIGRSGSAITVDLGNMKLHREVEGLALLGIDIRDFFIRPRLAGVVISQLMLSVYFAVIAIVSGVLFSALFSSASHFRYLVAIPLAFDPMQLIGFIIKDLLFGLIIGAAGCFHALQVTTSSTEVPQQTQRAIVNSLMLIFIIDGMVALAVQ